VQRTLDALDALAISRLRTSISWCDWCSDGGEDWYGWLLPRLLDRVEVLPCFLYTPPALGIMPKTSSPPREPHRYGEFVESVLRAYRDRFDYVELWNEPNNYIEWDWTIDPEWTIFARMIAGAASRAAALGVRSVLGGMSPFDPNWLDLMYKRGALEHVDVIGVHGFPGTWEAVWDGWDAHVARVEEVIARHGARQRVSISRRRPPIACTGIRYRTSRRSARRWTAFTATSARTTSALCDPAGSPSCSSVSCAPAASTGCRSS
jgi:CDP-paratose 2-epimerase